MSAGLPDIDSALLQKRIDELALITEAAPPVVTRVLFSDADLRGRDYIRNLCEEGGLGVRLDAVGNMFARWKGSAPDAPAVATGSHTDAIPNAGKVDGVVGVLGGLSAIEALQEAARGEVAERRLHTGLPRLWRRGQGRLPHRLQHERAALRDGQRVVAGLGQIGEQGAHLRGRLEAMFDRQPSPVVLRHIGAVGDAQQRVMRVIDVGT